MTCKCRDKSTLYHLLNPCSVCAQVHCYFSCYFVIYSTYCHFARFVTHGAKIRKIIGFVTQNKNQLRTINYDKL